MRGKKALINTFSAVLQEFVAVVCAFILPRLIMESFGSTYNGISSSITQFLGCAVLLRAGIGGATRAALYKPIAESDQMRVNAIMSATEKYLRKTALILAALIVAAACCYPFLVRDEFSWFFSFSLFLIIGISTFAETLFGISNLILLQADQKLYVSSIARIISTICNTVLSVVLIRRGCSIHTVKFGSAIAFCIYPLLLRLYVKRRYKIDTNVEPDNGAIAQRWDAFFHQVANFVMANTDVIVLTAFVPMSEVSVYSVYNLIANGLRKLVLNFTSGLEGAFGSMMAKDEKQVLRSNFEIIHFLIFTVASVVYTSAALLILDFVKLYTKGISDAAYIRPAFAYLLILGQFFLCVRQPYQVLVQAGGHYRETRDGAILEPILNIVISVAVVARFGLVGVVCGTLAATVFRTLQYSFYVSRHILHGALPAMLRSLLLSAANCAIVFLACHYLPLGEVSSYWSWLLRSVEIVVLSSSVNLITALVFYKNQVQQLLTKLRRIMKK